MEVYLEKVEIFFACQMGAEEPGLTSFMLG